MKFITEIFDFFLPRFCSSCSATLLTSRKILCENCLSDLKSPSEELLSLEYKRKFLKEGIIGDFAAAFIFETGGTIQHIIHELKYQKRFCTGIVLGKMSARILKERIDSWEADFIIPIPLHTLKKADRGFNQAFFVAKGISKITGLKVKSGILKRIKFTETQTHLTSIERKENIQHAFKLKNLKAIKNRNIILIDDVVTTGSTISECARILGNNGAANVFALSAAIADFDSTSFQERSNLELQDHF